MIISRSPLRISLGGGGTDLPSYFKHYGGFLIAAAIDKYVFATINRPFKSGLLIKYSSFEQVAKVSEVRHPIVREALSMLAPDTERIEITTLADIPAGTGLGSSGSFGTALIKGLHAYKRIHIEPKELAELACTIEIDRLKEPVGKQDQYIAAFGGLTCFTFNPDGSVEVRPLAIKPDALHELEENLMLFFTGYARSAGTVLQDQKVKSEEKDPDMLENLHFVKDLGLRSKLALERGDLAQFGALMHEHWERKRTRSGGMSNAKIDEWYELGRKSGALGGKLVGAGGGGFLMFYAENRQNLRSAMQDAGLQEVRFRFDFEGTKVVLS